jgi:F0F1-type ATP synthase alpha subunit
MDDVAPEDIPVFERQLVERFRSEYAGCYHEINRTGELTDDLRETLTAALTKYRAAWAQR